MNSKLLNTLIDSKGLDSSKLKPRLMKGGVYGYEISSNDLPEFEKAIRKAVASEMLGLADSSQPDLDFERINDERYTVESAYNQALYDYQTELVKTIKEWSSHE